jgi:hypothetical protein
MGSRRHNSPSLVGDMVGGQIASALSDGISLFGHPIPDACTSGNLQDFQAVLSGSKANCQRRQKRSMWLPGKL